MSENKHTNEPWPPFTDIATTMTPDPEGTPVAILSWDDYIRARACVNACKGISTDALEAEGSAVMGWNRTARKLIDVAKQRDELLSICAELQESAEYWSEYDVPLGIVGRLKAAIASVKGGVA